LASFSVSCHFCQGRILRR